jgi:high-affinity iron transporter
MLAQVLAGAGTGLLLAVAIGAAFIAVWFTKASDLWSKSEELWEGIFSIIASLMILAMGLGVLRMDRAKAKWRVKIRRAFEGKGAGQDRGSRTGRWALFVLPLVTVLREGGYSLTPLSTSAHADTSGLEAVIFVGGVSLGQPATSIPIAAIVGLVVGLIIGYIIYAFASRSALRIFMIVMTNFLLLIGAGLFSKAVWDFQEHAFNKMYAY